MAFPPFGPRRPRASAAVRRETISGPFNSRNQSSTDLSWARAGLAPMPTASKQRKATARVNGLATDVPPASPSEYQRGKSCADEGSTENCNGEADAKLAIIRVVGA